MTIRQKQATIAAPEDATASELCRALRAGELSAVELMRATLGRIDRLNPALNAIVTRDDDAALRRAVAADEALALGQTWGPLHGLPFTLKDCFETAGMRTTAGYPPLATHVPAADSTIAARLKAAGAILVGKTNVPTLAMSAQTDNPVFGRSHNPWQPGRTPGGSSGGAAAAVAARLVPFDIGSDMSGSIRIPAHFCGVYGFKASANRIPGTGHVPPPPGVPRLDRQLAGYGPLARSVADLALLAGVIAGADGVDAEVPPLPWRGPLPARDPRSLRIVWRSRWPGVPTARAVSAAVEGVARQLADAGAQVDEGDPGFTRDELMAVWGDYFDLASRAMMEVAGFTLPVRSEADTAPALAAWIRVLDRRDALLRAAEQALTQRFDAFLCPAAICGAFPHSPPRSPIAVDGEMVDSRYIDHYLLPWNLLGHPTVVMPVGLDPEGLPLAVQLVGARWRDEELLAAAQAVAAVAGECRRPPEPGATSA